LYIARFQQEMKSSPVVPDMKLVRWRKGGNIALYPVYEPGFFTQSYTGPFQSGCRDIQYGNVVKPFIQQVVNEQAVAAANVYDRHLGLQSALFNQMKGMQGYRLVPPV
jgi:hypothetical protein